jgi:hypothetical protein
VGFWIKIFVHTEIELAATLCLKKVELGVQQMDLTWISLMEFKLKLSSSLAHLMSVVYILQLVLLHFDFILTVNDQ